MAKSRRHSWPQPIVKALFGKAANRCSICKTSVTELPKKRGDKIVVIGEIAHINAIASNGPRGTTIVTKQELNDYDNLILLCANCHAKIDRLEATYTTEELKKIKREHEARNDKLTSGMDTEKARSIIATYVQEFQSAYREQVAQFVPSEYKLNNQPVQFEDALFQDHLKQNLIILGGSGRGKSLLAKYIGVQAIDSGEIPIMVEVIQFSKQIEPHFEKDEDVSTVSFKEIEDACTILQKKALLIVDGYNECPEEIRVKLNLWIISFINSLQARLIITSQTQIEGLHNTNLAVIEVLPPSLDIKRRIALSGRKNVSLEKIDPLLEAVSTNLEARLIGEVAQTISPDSSRYAIYDLYVRERLKDGANSGIDILVTTAEYLYDKITFSLSARDFGRLLTNKHIVPRTDELLFKSGLLMKRSDRVFFVHELFFNAFSAEAIVRNASGNANKILQSLSAPKHKEQRVLILGAIDDINLLGSVLPLVNDFDLIAACISGDCGAYAKVWAERECVQLFDKIKIEINNLSFEIAFKPGNDGKEFWVVSLVEETVREWSDQEKCFVHALPLLLFKGKYLKEIFELINLMDQFLTREFSRLRPLAIEKGISIRSRMFEQVYMRFSAREVSTGMILSNFISGGWSVKEYLPSNALFEFIHGLLSPPLLSYGQLFLIVHLVQKFRWQNEQWESLFAPHLPSLLKEEKWKFYPYHLKLALLDVAHYSSDTPEEQKTNIIEELNNLLKISGDDWVMPTFIMDALQGLGALEDEEIAHEKTARAELENILRGNETTKKCSAAFGFHTRSFDHPYQGAYWKAISELNEADSKKFYTMALKGVGEFSWGVSIVIYNVAKFEDPSTANVIRPFTQIPPISDSSPQESTETCLLAHIVMGWLGAEIHSRLDSEISDAAKAYTAYAEIMYWGNRRDLSVTDRRKSMSKAWAVLLDHKRGVSIDALRNYNRIIGGGIRHFARDRDVTISMTPVYEKEIAEICRQGLSNPKIQSGYFSWTKQSEILSYAIHTLGRYGDIADLPLLKTYSVDRELGTGAISAVGEIELRSQGSVNS
jgi:DNA replication protein DnaC